MLKLFPNIPTQLKWCNTNDNILGKIEYKLSSTHNALHFNAEKKCQSVGANAVPWDLPRE